MKRIFAIVAPVVIIAFLIGCGGEATSESNSNAATDETPEASPQDETVNPQDTPEVQEQKPVFTAEQYVAMAMDSAKSAGIPEEDLVHFDVLKKTYPDHAHGIDVSHHQGEVDWAIVKETGIDFVYLKATEGIDYQDPMFARNWKDADEAGLLRGAYHMYRPEDSAYEQMRNFIETVAAIGTDDAMLPPVLDIERVRTVDSIKPAVLHERAVLWLKGVADELGVRPLVYTNPTFWRDYLTGDHELTRFMLWISEYDLDATNPASTGAWKEWTFWQFSRYGIVPGVPKPVDLNRYFNNPEHLTTIEKTQ